ncbi:MAG: GNAT family protein [Chloroflexota bacterium]|nr:GNAT family protein [Chloroflexota bacterium]
MKIEIGDWQIRSWLNEDEASLVKYANNRAVSMNLRDAFPYPYTQRDARDWIRTVSRQVPESQWAIASGEEAIGGIGLQLGDDIFRRTAKIGYWLGEPFWGIGIATRAVEEVTNYAFSQFDLDRIHAEVFEWNPASARVLEKAGYCLEGRLRRRVIKAGKTIDCFLYAKIREQ